MSRYVCIENHPWTARLIIEESLSRNSLRFSINSESTGFDIEVVSWFFLGNCSLKNVIILVCLYIGCIEMYS